VVELSPDGQSPGGGWPEPGRSGQLMDYGLDREITDSSEYCSAIMPGLRALPSISLVTDLTNLFDSELGIYVNAQNVYTFTDYSGFDPEFVGFLSGVSTLERGIDFGRVYPQPRTFSVGIDLGL